TKQQFVRGLRPERFSRRNSSRADARTRTALTTIGPSLSGKRKRLGFNSATPNSRLASLVFNVSMKGAKTQFGQIYQFGRHCPQIRHFPGMKPKVRLLCL